VVRVFIDGAILFFCIEATKLSVVQKSLRYPYRTWKRLHSTASRKWQSLPVACPWSVFLSGYSSFVHH